MIHPWELDSTESSDVATGPGRVFSDQGAEKILKLINRYPSPCLTTRGAGKLRHMGHAEPSIGLWVWRVSWLYTVTCHASDQVGRQVRQCVNQMKDEAYEQHPLGEL